MIVNKYLSADDAARQLTEKIIELIQFQSQQPFFSITLSGGNNPALLFDLWASDYKQRIPWKQLHLYWVDERCVPPTNTDSNYLMTKNHLLDLVPIPHENIFRIHGEANPSDEAFRYTSLVRKNLLQQNELPVFDCILLGIGPDGHTSSIFPKQTALLDTSTPYIVNEHPQTKQKRIALTPRTILNAKKIIFFATGSQKREIIRSVISGNIQYPAGYIVNRAPETLLYTDQ
jgi:6-phosphogluconolactonase